VSPKKIAAKVGKTGEAPGQAVQGETLTRGNFRIGGSEILSGDETKERWLEGLRQIRKGKMREDGSAED